MSPATNSPGWLDSRKSGSRASGHQLRFGLGLEIASGHEVTSGVAPQPVRDAGCQRFAAFEDEHPACVEQLLPIWPRDHDALEPVAPVGLTDVCACPDRDPLVGFDSVDEVSRHRLGQRFAPYEHRHVPCVCRKVERGLAR